jgi:hypothetical protein
MSMQKIFRLFDHFNHLIDDHDRFKLKVVLLCTRAAGTGSQPVLNGFLQLVHDELVPNQFRTG